MGRQDLDGHVAFELGVPGSVHLTHAARSERFDNFVLIECLADQGSVDSLARGTAEIYPLVTLGNNGSTGLSSGILGDNLGTITPIAEPESP